MKKLVYIALITVLISLQLQTGNAYSRFTEQQSIDGNTFSTAMPEVIVSPTPIVTIVENPSPTPAEISPTSTEIPSPTPTPVVTNMISPTPTPIVTLVSSPTPSPTVEVSPTLVITATTTPAVSPTPQPALKVCQLEADSDDILLDLGGKVIWANIALSDAQYTLNGNVPNGTYKVSMTTYDNHSTKPSQYQPNEEFFVILKDENGDEVTRTNAISDLPDHMDLKSEVVNNSLTINSDIKVLQPYHNDYPSQDNIANTIHPVCILFEPIEPSPTPTPPEYIPVYLPEMPVSSPVIEIEESKYQEECEIEVIEEHVEELQNENNNLNNASFLERLLRSLFETKDETPEYIDKEIYEEKVEECIEEKEEEDTEITNYRLQNTNDVVSPTPEPSPSIEPVPTVIPSIEPNPTVTEVLIQPEIDANQNTNYEVQNTSEIPAQSAP